MGLHKNIYKLYHSDMHMEQFSNAPRGTADEETEEMPARRIATGPFAPDPEDQLRDTQAFLADLDTPRDENEEMHVPQELHEVNANIAELDKRIARKKEEETALGNVRAGLDVPHETGSTLTQLEAARKRLEEEKRRLEFADMHEPAFDELSDLSSSEQEYIAKTGKTRDGRSLHDKNGERVRENVAKELAHTYMRGGGHLTLKDLRKLEKVADKVLHDVTSAFTGTVKSMFMGSPNPKKGDEQSFSA